jgi:hypothetical protein
MRDIQTNQTTMTSPELKPTVLEVQVNAALAGHDLGPFEEVDNGYQVACR